MRTPKKLYSRQKLLENCLLWSSLRQATREQNNGERELKGGWISKDKLKSSKDDDSDAKELMGIVSLYKIWIYLRDEEVKDLEKGLLILGLSGQLCLGFDTG